MAETEQRYLSVVTRGCYLGVPWHNEVAVYCSDRHAFTNLCLSLCLQGESDVGVHDRVIVLTAHKLNIKADVEMRGRAQMAEEEEDPTG